MAVLFIFVFLLVSICVGTLLCGIFRERKLGWPETVALGFLSLFALFFVVLLAGVKLDFSVSKLAKIYVCAAGVLTLAGAAVFIFRRPKNPVFDKKLILVLVPSVILGLVSFILLAPSYINDDTWEIVATSISSDSMYVFSSMTGEAIQYGLPIYNKILIMPMFYSAICSFFNISMRDLAGIAIPVLVSAINIALIYAISDNLNVKRKEYFTLTYMIILIAGTYLPVGGVPVTVGYAVLREGYSGYALFYGVAIPLFVLLVLKKSYFLSIVSLFPGLGLVRLDRIYYELLNPVNAFTKINISGKLFAVYVLAFVSAFVIWKLKNEKVSFVLFFVPSLFISYQASKLYDIFEDKKKRTIFGISVLFLFLFACGLRPYEDAVWRFEEKREEAAVSDILETVGYGSKLWAPVEFMETAKRIDGSLKLLYGRDDVSSYLPGVDYDKHTDYTLDYYYALLNINIGQTFYETKHDMSDVIAAAKNDGAEYVILNGENGYEALPIDELKYD